jgi:hypothetical protein
MREDNIRQATILKAVTVRMLARITMIRTEN